MSVSTSNAYGKISISDLAIAKVASRAAVESYGIVDTVAHRFADTLAELLGKDAGERASVLRRPATASSSTYMCSSSTASPSRRSRNL